MCLINNIAGQPNGEVAMFQRRTSFANGVSVILSSNPRLIGAYLDELQGIRRGGSGSRTTTNLAAYEETRTYQRKTSIPICLKRSFLLPTNSKVWESLEMILRLGGILSKYIVNKTLTTPNSFQEVNSKHGLQRQEMPLEELQLFLTRQLQIH